MENGRKHLKSIAGNKVAHLTNTRKELQELFTLQCSQVQSPRSAEIVPCVDYYLNS